MFQISWRSVQNCAYNLVHVTRHRLDDWRRRRLANDYETPSNYRSTNEARRRAASGTAASRTPSRGRVIRASFLYDFSFYTWPWQIGRLVCIDWRAGVCWLTGGYTAGPKQLTDLLRNRSRPYLYSNALPPPVVAVTLKVCLSATVTCTLKGCHGHVSYVTKLIVVSTTLNIYSVTCCQSWSEFVMWCDVMCTGSRSHHWLLVRVIDWSVSWLTWVSCDVMWCVQALDLITGSSDLIDQLLVNTKTFRLRMTQAGFTLLVRRRRFSDSDVHSTQYTVLYCYSTVTFC